MDERQPDSGFFRELTRRRVFRSAAAYAVVAWVAVQAGSIVFPAFDAPVWAMRALIIVCIVGFPPAMLIAWSVDIGGEGVTRTPESGYSRRRGMWPKLTMVLASTAISGAALFWVWDDYIVQRGARPALPAPGNELVVAVQPARQLAGGDEIAWLGDGIANLLRSELTESRHVIVISQARWQALTDGVTERGAINALANRIGVDYLIDGELFETPSGIVLTTHVVDVQNGVEFLSPRTTGRDVAAVIAGVTELAISIKQALRIPHQQQVGLFEADFAVEHIDAYEASIAGLAYFVNFDYQAAERAFQTALEIAPDYHVARFRLAQVYEATGRAELARSTLDAIPTEGHLPERLRLYVEGAKAYFIADRDPARAIEIYRELVALYPYETEAGQLLAEAYWLDFQDDAAIGEFRRLAEIHPYDPVSWMALGERLLDVGRLEEARPALERYAEMQPEDAYAFVLLGNLALLQQDFASSAAQHERALELRPGFPVARLGFARSCYLDGRIDDAIALWQGLVDDTAAAPGYRIDAAFDLSGVLRGRGQFAASLAPTETLMPLIREENLRVAMALSERASTLYELGRVDEALALFDEVLPTAPQPATRYYFAAGLIQFATTRIDALLATIEILNDLQEADSPVRSDAKAADYLAGLHALSAGDTASARALLRRAVDAPGYQYAIYRVGLAQCLYAAGENEAAALMAAEAARERDAGDPRLDLELDRARALLLHAEILAGLGRSQQARKPAREFLDRWRDAPADRRERLRAEAVLAAM
ncbi:MAG: tetratricopeptide repeat protein [Woeseia sp.]